VGIAVNAQFAGSQDFLITDNVMIGRDDRYRLLGWYAPWDLRREPPEELPRSESLWRRHVVSHNYIAYFHDGISVCTHGSPDRKKTIAHPRLIFTITTFI
jgi:hypothetical protein